ncbi:MAG: outer membrane beta-barrel protein [Paludibacter sp.]
MSGKIVVKENDDTIPLGYATVRLLSIKDSTMIAGKMTDELGNFDFKATAGKDYLLFVSCLGYKNLYQSVQITPNEPRKNLNDIVLHENTITLGEATVVGQRSEMVVKTDTLEYNAAAYKLKDNAVVGDLLKRLPGITITEDGKILVNGKEVKKVMVDGKDFFRSNPNLTIKNIPAEIMDKLQIIDDKSELSKLTGVDDGEENTTINITIQKGKKRGWLVSSNMGAGQELNGSEGNLMRYSVNTFAARLVEESQLGIVANGNNINGMNAGSGGSTAGSGKPGLNSSLSGGINFSSGKDNNSNTPKEPWLMNGDISYGFNETVVRRNSMRQYYLQDSTSFQTDTAKQFSRENGIRFSAKIENRKLDNWVFSFSPSASYVTTTRNDEGYTLLQAGNTLRDSVNSNRYKRSSNTPELNLRGIFTISHDFAKKNRKLSLSLDSKFSNSEGDGETNAQYFYYRSKKLVNRDQQWENNATNFTNRMYVSYIEPIAEKHSLQFVYWVQTSNRENIKNNFKPDLLTNEYTVLDLPYSKSLDNYTLTQQLGISYRGVLKKLSYTIGVDYNPSYIRSLSFIQNGAASGLDSTITYFPGLQTFNYAPNAYLTYNMGKGKNIRFDYRGRSESPSVYQLDPSRDETNPTNIRMGNPNLSPKFTHWSRFRFTNNNRKTQQSLIVNVEGNYILNDIINFTNYDDVTGVKTTMPINQSGSWNANGMMMYNRPIGSHFQINNYTQLAVRNNIGFSTINKVAESQKTIATTSSAKEELGLTFKWEWLYMITKANYELANTTYSVESMLSKRTSSLGGFFNAQFTLPKSWTISTELNYRSLTGFSAEYNRSEMLWNAEISKNFLKHNSGTITLLFNDILQQQLSVNQIVSSNYVEDQQFNTLKSFVMLVFSYRFNTMGGKKN